MNADQKMAAIQADLDKLFQGRMDATPNDSSLEAWHQARALAYAEQAGRLTYELRKALRTIESLASKLDATGFQQDEVEGVFFGTVDGVPCALDLCEETGAVQCVYIAGQWVEPEFFSDRAHKAWTEQRQRMADKLAAQEVAA
jgi:hypothetical protein